MTNALTTATPEVAEEKDLKLVEQGIALFQSAPAILRANQQSVTRALAAAQALLDKYAANNYKLTEELDNEAKDLLVKINATAKKLKESREPITQIFDAVKKMFTTLEGKLDTKEIANLPAQLQKARNDWAKFVIEEEARKKKEAEEKAAVEKAKAELLGWIVQKIGELLSKFISDKKLTWTSSFNAITLANFDEKSAGLQNVNCEFTGNFHGMLTYELPFTPRLLEDERTQVRIKAHNEYDFEGWKARYKTEMEELKASLVDRLPSKKRELEEAAEAERLRQEEVERQKERERIRQEQIAKSNAEEKARLEEQARIDREKEQQRLAEIEAEQKRQEQERLQREKEEQERLAKEKEESDRKAKEQAELASASMIATSLFDQATSISDTVTAPEARTGFEIAVKHSAGWVEIFQFWYQREGVKLSIDEMGKKSLNQMKKYAEDVAKKTDERIESKYLTYNVAVKAVNRKEKA